MSPRPALLALLASAAALLGTAPAGAQASEPTPLPADRPVVGLVLAGGSAKGIAHVGAIRAIEEAGVPVDVVTGTSMGSIVGSLYALGYTPDEMAGVVGSRDWAALFTDAVDRREASVERRLAPGAAVLSLPLAGGAVSLPSGLVAGQGVFDLLAQLAWPALDVRDFRALPRPFAAVAVDTETGEAARLDRGSLPLAVRASMSLPSLFEPVEIDGRRYIDGGLVRNLPAEDALALGADVLVCVDVSANDTTGTAPPTFFDVFVDAAFIAANQNLREQRALCDVTIEPDVQGLSSFAFDAADEWIARGEAAGRDRLPALRALADRLGNPPRPAPPPVTSAPVRLARVEVRGVDGPAARFVRVRLPDDLTSGRPVAPEEVSALARSLYATGAFDLVTYRVERDAGGDAVLVLDARAAAGDRLGFGFRYDTAYDAALLFSLTLRDRLVFGSTARLEARLGEQTQLQGGYLARLGLATPWTVAGVAGYTAVPVQVFAGADRPQAAGDLEVLSARAYAGPTLFGRVLTGLGGAVTYGRAEPEVAPDGTEAVTDTYASLSAFAAADSRDRPAFATRGVRVALSADASPGLGADFARLGAEAEAAVPVAPGVSLVARGAVVAARGEPPLDQLVYLGGPIAPTVLPGRFYPLFGADEQELVGRSAAFAAVGVQARVPGPDALGGLLVRAVVDAGRVGEDLSFDADRYRVGYGLSLGAATPVGPAELVLSGEAFDGAPGLAFRFGRDF